MFLACFVFLLDSCDYWVTNQLRRIDKNLASTSLNVQNGTVTHTYTCYSLYFLYLKTQFLSEENWYSLGPGEDDVA